MYSITYEEFRFAKFIIRIQNCFAGGIQEGFKTHLKLKGLWDQHNLRDRDINVAFTSPIIYEIYTQQRLLEIKTTNYSSFNDAMDPMNSYALMKYLDIDAEEISIIWKMKEEDAELAGELAALGLI